MPKMEGTKRKRAEASTSVKKIKIDKVCNWIRITNTDLIENTCFIFIFQWFSFTISVKEVTEKLKSMHIFDRTKQFYKSSCGINTFSRFTAH